MLKANKRAFLILSSMLLIYSILRIYLYFSPNTNFDIGPYNIHHLYTGILLMVIFALPLILFSSRGHAETINSIGFGSGLGLTLDEWVFLIATDGSDKSYLTPVSFWGSIIIISLTSIYIVILLLVNKRKT